MNARKRLYALFTLLVLSALAAAGCATQKANKLIEEGNSAVREGEKFAMEADAKITELANNLNGYPGNRDQLKPTAEAVNDNLDKGIAKLKEAASKFNEGSQTNLDAPLKEYLSLKAQEFSKHAEHLETLKGIPAAFLDASVEDRESLDEKLNPIREKVQKLEQEWTDLAQRANKIQEANKDKFKS